MKTGLSIITVVRNDLSGLQTTGTSIAKFAAGILANGGLVEWIIVDGASTDATAAFALTQAASMVPCPVRAQSERDRGIYDAMNKGTHMAQYSHCWYLNAGDIICKSADQFDLILEAVRRNLAAIICFGCIRSGRIGKVTVQARKAGYLIYSLPTSHQAMLIPSRIAQAFPYSTQYVICGDYEFACRAWRAGHDFIPISFALAEFVHDGLSSKRPFLLIKEAAIVQRRILKLRWPFIIAAAAKRACSLAATRMLDLAPIIR